jgi:Methyltransferase domain
MHRIPIADRRRATIATLLAVLLPFAATVHAAEPDFEPRVGQAGKDVIWVPTPNALIDRMLRMANVGPSDRLVDLGSGDGRIAIAAARDFNVASATGIEYNPAMVTLSNRNATDQGVAQRVKFIEGDIFATDFSDATVVTMYLLPSLNLRLRPTLLDMKPGTRIVSHAFTMEDWRPDDQAEVEGQNAYFWIVPARVGGTWRVQVGTQNTEIKLAQTFQDFEGVAGPSGLPVKGTLKGDEIRFTLPDGRGGQRELVGKVTGEQMSGRAGADTFTATRTALPAAR